MKIFSVIFCVTIFTTGFIFVSTQGSFSPLEAKTKSVAVSLPKIGEGTAVKKILATATAYGPPDFPEGQATYSGEPVKFGIVAVSLDDPKIPFGSRIKIDGFGDKVFLALDTGKKVGIGQIDIYLPNAEQAVKFGRQPKVIHVLKR